MPIGLLALAGLALPFVVAYAATPVAIRVAGRFDFYDRPSGYKGHGRPTPYLGGAAVVGAFVLAALIVAGQLHRTLPVVGGMLLLWGVGTVDDRVGLSPWLRLAVEGALAVGLWALGLGWDLGLGGVLDLVVTVVWIAAVVNAFNLFDNMDGAASSLAAAAAAGTALLGIVLGDRWLTAAAAALCGACLGFLPHNLSRPAKIFLGDGGSMPVGFAVGALVMIGSAGAASEWQALAMGLLFVGIPAVDTCLVIVSRRRRGVPLLTGGRDHLTHRARSRLQTAGAVSVSLGAAQTLLAALALMTVHHGSGALVAVVCVYVVAAVAVIALLDADYRPEVQAGDVALDRPPRRRDVLAVGAAGAVVPLALAAGLSSFWAGAYDSTKWAPVGLGLIALLIAAAVAAPLRPSRPAVLALGGLAGLAGWALLSSAWGYSPYAAIVGGNRLAVLAAVLALGVLLVRTRRAAVVALAAATVGTLCVAGWELVEMLAGGASDVLAGGRLQGPLGYINGQGCVAALGFFPCLALAERRGRPWLAAGGLAGATVLGSLVELSQARGAVLGVLVGLAVAFVAAPGRLRRVATVGLVALAALGASHWLLEVYRQGHGARVLPRDVAQAGALAILAAALAAAVAWRAVLALEDRTDPAVLVRAARGWRWTLGLAAVGLALTAGVRGPAVANAVSDQLHQLSRGKAVDVEPGASSTRLALDTSNRYEYWRIALRAFRAHPLGGVGAGSYDVPYFRQRTTTENITQPHSLVLQTLAELGVVGGLLLALFLGGVGWGLVRAARAARGSPADAGLVVAAGGTFAAWLVHTSVDWIHLLPGVTAVALLAAAALVRPVAAVPDGAAAVAPGRHRRPRPLAVVVPLLAVIVVGAAVSLAREVLAERYRGAAEATVAAHPAEALHQADLALGVEGSDTRSLDVEAAALSRLGREREAGAVLMAALRQEPDNFVTYLLLGDHEFRSGRAAAATRWYRRAQALNPRDPTIQALARGRGG